jgi:ubiquinone/menaquinone biosynthesis C-methylase UbiE
VIEINWATPLYEFLRQCNAIPLPKNVLDCGAGGSQPPLSMFYAAGYKTYGIEIAQDSLQEAQQFCAESQMVLNIIGGDMRQIPFQEEQFSFVYSYNAIDFMTKPDIAIAMGEITRVLKSGGLCYVNYLSVDDAESWEPFCETAVAQDLLKSKGFAHFEDDEADVYFRDYLILRKEKKLVEKYWEGLYLKQADISYIAKKEEG